MNFLLIINGAAYGQETRYNAVRLAKSLSRRDEATRQAFLMGGGVTTAMAGQKTPEDYDKLDRMLLSITRRGSEVRSCSTCMDARGITDAMLIEGATRSTMDVLADWTIAADKVLVF